VCVCVFVDSNVFQSYRPHKSTRNRNVAVGIKGEGGWRYAAATTATGISEVETMVMRRSKREETRIVTGIKVRVG